MTALKRIKDTFNETQADFRATHTTRCTYCNRELTDPNSVFRGYGDECSRKHNQILTGMAGIHVLKQDEALEEMPKRFKNNLSSEDLQFIQDKIKSFKRVGFEKTCELINTFKKNMRESDILDKFKINAHIKSKMDRGLQKDPDYLKTQLIFILRDLNHLRTGMKTVENLHKLPLNSYATTTKRSIQNFCRKKTAETMNHIYSINPELITEDKEINQYFRLNALSNDVNFEMNLNSTLQQLVKEMIKGLI